MIVSVDIETDGPCPGKHSMLQLGWSIFEDDGSFIEKEFVNIETLPGAIQDPSTMKWWATQGDLYSKTRDHMVDPKEAMQIFVDSIYLHSDIDSYQSPTFVAYPLAFDWFFIRWYAENFMADPAPFHMSACLDIKSYAAGILKDRLSFRNTTKRRMPTAWKSNLPKHDHNAANDAYEQGVLYFRIKNHGN